jgi:hypothetical protein
MAKKQTLQTIVTDYVKNAHPMYFAYFVQRIEADCDLIIAEIPKIKEEDDKAKENGKISIFHPNYYVNYVNQQIDLINEVRKLYSKSSNEPFILKEKLEYFND